eukprot:COSAG02_NODE_41219_length_397_cov_0.546980_1_plen_31_part_01
MFLIVVNQWGDQLRGQLGKGAHGRLLADPHH